MLLNDVEFVHKLCVVISNFKFPTIKERNLKPHLLLLRVDWSYEILFNAGHPIFKDLQNKIYFQPVSTDAWKNLLSVKALHPVLVLYYALQKYINAMQLYTTEKALCNLVKKHFPIWAGTMNKCTNWLCLLLPWIVVGVRQILHSCKHFCSSTFFNWMSVHAIR